jgi:pyruvate formate lyase activating enzyme
MPVVESMFYETLQDRGARCTICERRCVIPEGGFGFCATRQNRKGRIYSTTYGETVISRVAPIEAKPVYHFLPGSRWFSLGGLGCNLRCAGCQNSEISHEEPCEIPEGKTTYLQPEKVVELAREQDCAGISFTYNEPTMWLEYTIKTCQLAHKAGLYTNYVTNGYMTSKALDKIGPHLDVFRVDIKGFSRDFYRKVAKIDDFEPILENTMRAKSKWNAHVEIVTNVIPGYNDGDIELGRLATWIATRLGKRTPWHLTRFLPYRELADVPCTPVETLDGARKIGFDVGLLYVYVGNVIGHPGTNTYCPKCGKVVIGRHHFSVIANNLTSPEDGRCKYCDQRIAGVWSPPDIL